MQPRPWKYLVCLAAFVVVVSAPPALAAATVDGTWEWSVTTPNGQTFEQRAKLRQNGERLTGVVTGPNNQEMEIKDGRISKDGDISFTVTRERQGQMLTTKYAGKLEGDTIKGKYERQRGEGTRSREWVAKRAKDEAK